MFAIKNLIEKSDLNTPQRLSRLRELGIVEELEKYLNSTSRESSRSSEEYVFSLCSKLTFTLNLFVLFFTVFAQ